MENNCKSCGYEITEPIKFCPNCGGKVIHNRLTLKNVFAEFFVTFFSWDNKFWKTVKAMVLQPEDVFTSFISGARKKYFHPVSLLLISVTVYVLINQFFNIDMSDIININTDKSTEDAMKFQEQISTEIAEFMRRNLSVLTYLSIPIYALTSFFVFYSKKKYNYAEFLVINIYLIAFTTYFSIIFQVILFYLLPSYKILSICLGIAMFLYINYAYIRLFKLKTKGVIISNLKLILFGFPIYAVFYIALTAIILVYMIVTEKLTLPQ